MPVPPYPTVPAPTTYANGPLAVSELRADVTNGVSFLSNRPSFTALCTSGPALTSGVYLPVNLDTELNDPWAGHSPLGGSPQNYYCQAPDWYLAEGYVPFSTYAGTAPADFGAALGVNTASGLARVLGEQHPVASAAPGVIAADLVQLARTGVPGSSGSDFVQLQGFADTTGITLSSSAPDQPRLSVRWACTGSASSLAVPSNAAFPVPPAFVDRAWLDANIRDTLKFLENPPALRARQATTVIGNFASGAWPAATVMPLNAANLDNYSALDTTAHQWTAPQPGEHYIYAQVATAYNASGDFAAGVTVNSVTTWGKAVQASSAAPAGEVIVAACGRFRLNAGDTVSLAGFQNTGSPQTTQADDTRLIILWESA